MHVNNLASIVGDGFLWSDEMMANRQGGAVIGMASIKQRRLTLPVKCHPGSFVGGYVPFYFCPRSIMLFVISCANHSELAYQEGQGEIVHLEADMYRTVQWAQANRKRWAFSLSNAGAYYTQILASLDHLGKVNRDAVAATDFRPADIKEGKQAEFLMEHSFPWGLVERIGVMSRPVAQKVSNAMGSASHRAIVEVKRNWYY